jgi:hypothetical protein
MPVTPVDRKHGRHSTTVATSREERQELEAHHNWDMQDLEDWLTSIEDRELITRAAQMDLSLDDISQPASQTRMKRKDIGRTPNLGTVCFQATAAAYFRRLPENARQPTAKKGGRFTSFI